MGSPLDLWAWQMNPRASFRFCALHATQGCHDPTIVYHGSGWQMDGSSVLDAFARREALALVEKSTWAIPPLLESLLRSGGEPNRAQRRASQRIGQPLQAVAQAVWATEAAVGYQAGRSTRSKPWQRAWRVAQQVSHASTERSDEGYATTFAECGARLGVMLHRAYERSLASSLDARWAALVDGGEAERAVLLDFALSRGLSELASELRWSQPATQAAHNTDQNNTPS